MTDFSSEIKLILEAGTWANFGETPPFMELNEENIRGNPDLGVSIEERRTAVPQTYTGKTIREIQSGDITVWARDRADRDSMYQDVKDILHSSDLHVIDTTRKANWLDYFLGIISISRTSPSTSSTIVVGARNQVILIDFTIKDLDGNTLFKIDGNTGIPANNHVLVWNATNGSFENKLINESITGIDAPVSTFDIKIIDGNIRIFPDKLDSSNYIELYLNGADRFIQKVNGGILYIESDSALFSGIQAFETPDVNYISMVYDKNNNRGVIISDGDILLLAGGDVSVQSKQVKDVATPTLSTDATNKAYVDAQIEEAKRYALLIGG